MIHNDKSQKILTLNFENYKKVVLQYHPNQLAIEESTLHNTLPTIGGATTFFAAPNSKKTTYRFSASFYSTEREEFDPTKNLALAGVGAAAPIIKSLVDATGADTDAVFSTITLAKGLYDAANGTITSFATSTNIDIGGGFNKNLTILRQNQKLGTPCSIVWDVENNSRPTQDSGRYIITSLNTSAVSIQEETGGTIAADIDITLINVGTNTIGGKDYREFALYLPTQNITV